MFDASSGNSLPLWANKRVLSPGTHCVLFGFGSQQLTLTQECLQISGLKISTSRGVGDIENRIAAIAMIRQGATDFILEKFITGAQQLNGLDEALSYIKAQHALSQKLFSAPRAYMVPNNSTQQLVF